ncbi:nucleotidyl transferase AbiEii/AbiGii toxin family protein [Pseudactinotalea sp. HY160]|uniref:nucleotidyl transferase AbiEii/AbiGii toxin family protein n=1 Tax=Pseudactinotalea sp. HY160 TaxID=2654490 RepID=UPI00128B15FF|nr:nucleotidyl transferase AbiEii/AbiGii toxin family protein [Pseudactinotalea sp. HY160]MPV50655.1 nucleotidyl transferase AbiEii/AbiGii toxin family protein [Pseudactinotalea sp. HY160]
MSLAPRTPVAWRRSIGDRARNAAQGTGRRPGDLQRQFVYSRFLARVFQDETWVLKGGVAVLARVIDARHSKDIDLLAALTDIDDAVLSLRAACGRKADDPFTFQITGRTPTRDNDGQPAVNGAELRMEALIGPTSIERFRVDLVVGSTMTAEPEKITPPMPFEMEGIRTPIYRVYPAVDHVADKLCATESRYGIDRDRRSSRARDLVDLVVFARTQEFDAGALWNAIEAERSVRNLPAAPALDVPSSWAPQYAQEARSTPVCSGMDFDAAVTLSRSFLDPVLSGVRQSGHWDPTACTWARY